MIRLPEIFLIDSDGTKLGVTRTDKARDMAQKQGLDLVEVAANSRPPVCRIMDFGQFLFDQKKKAKAQKKAGKSNEQKGVRFGIRISEHDLLVKVRASRKFLIKGHPLKVVLQFRGREITHADLGFTKMKEFAKHLEEVAKIDQFPKKQGRQIFMTMTPLPKSQQKLTEKEQAANK